MEKDTLKKIILEQKETFRQAKDIVERHLPENVLSSPKIAIITGIRRCGKSTLLYQISKKHHEFGYFNFEDERLLDFSVQDFNVVLEIFLESNPDIKVFFFDEIQNVFGWETFARRLFNEGYKLFITGSNARLLSSDIATALTGRNLKLELFPFGFSEYLQYSRYPIKEMYTTKEVAAVSKLLEDYLVYGGFPEVVKSKDYEELKEIYQDIIIKDLLVRFSIRDSKDFRELALYLLSNTSQKVSFNNLKDLLHFSTTSKVKNYVDFLSQAYLLFTVFKYDYSLRKQIKNDRKVYAIDQGLINAVSFSFGKEMGKLLENVVFLELKRRKQEVYYYQGKKECDFILKEGTKIAAAIQVAKSLEQPETKRREIEGLQEAMKTFNLKKGFIIIHQGEETSLANKAISVLPLWKFLLYGLGNSLLCSSNNTPTFK